jgi:ATP-dependent DNA helicase RecQ
VQYAEAEECRRIPLMRYFGEDYAETACGMCDNCVEPPRHTDDLTIAAQMFLRALNAVKRNLVPAI